MQITELLKVKITVHVMICASFEFPVHLYLEITENSEFYAVLLLFLYLHWSVDNYFELQTNR